MQRVRGPSPFVAELKVTSTMQKGTAPPKEPGSKAVLCSWVTVSARHGSRFSGSRLQTWTLASAKHQKTWRHLEIQWIFILILRISSSFLLPCACVLHEGRGEELGSKRT